jgi:hypothetical protein
MAAAAALSLVHAFVVITLRADRVVSGLAPPRGGDRGRAVDPMRSRGVAYAEWPDARRRA